MKHLHSNGYGFIFQTKLYPSPMQGEQAPAGVIAGTRFNCSADGYV